MLASIVDGAWRPGIGDPTFLGWATVVAYASAGALGWWAFVATRRGCGQAGGASRGGQWFWAFVGVAMLLLAVNKQLDLQSWLTQTGRRLAKQGGWYADRHEVQRWFIVAMVAAGAAGAALLAWFARRRGLGVQVAAAGMVMLVCFVVVRAASFHHVDRLLGVRLGGAKVNVLMEMGGIATVAAGAMVQLIRGGKTERP